MPAARDRRSVHDEERPWQNAGCCREDSSFSILRPSYWSGRRSVEFRHRERRELPIAVAASSSSCARFLLPVAEWSTGHASLKSQRIACTVLSFFLAACLVPHKYSLLFQGPFSNLYQNPFPSIPLAFRHRTRQILYLQWLPVHR